MNEIALSSDINVITAEINSYKQIAGQSIWEIGRRLNYVKENDLVHGEFMNWLESKNMNYRVANKFMNIAKELPNMTTSSNLSYEALYLITTLPEENKREEVKKIAEGNPSTTREVQELKKQLKQKDERISALESAEPRVIEKRVEVPPSDYYSLQRANETLTSELLRSSEKVKQVESTKSLLEARYKLLESESREAKELKKHIDSLRDEKDSINNQVKLLTEFNKKTKDLKRAFDEELASLHLIAHFIMRLNYFKQMQV